MKRATKNNTTASIVKLQLFSSYLPLPILNNQLFAMSTNSEFLAFTNFHFADKLFWDIDVVAIPTVFHNFSDVFFHILQYTESQ